ncbi:ArsI/CadI family heavy metal resistance metalloenzyme [Denitrobaculum tricleocarpae]|uniref:Glyoxalase/bleomycin resistance/extradiol dioxygenase family protein n=1 Tax=Denitrobaculum tricleocarpae TaxID=2591009 RepID=A0A545TU05_9PROT|nr:ArsI/CadI family heavy metal resistance metalloenzyme [Denitrobaculum tricleocarpae]TQV80696.1 glyoxalase/bleomycin resistance/extradiol dioxygenase family protein [Denitrobaculum tricleocarpae]
MRLQLALNVRDIDEAVDYYSRLFDSPPHKRRPGYANFAISQPPLKLVLFENPGAPELLNHLGVEVQDADTLQCVASRLEQSGLLESLEQGRTCCHAEQDKVWSRDLQGLRWEWYRITDDTPEVARQTPIGRCCTGAATESC